MKRHYRASFRLFTLKKGEHTMFLADIRRDDRFEGYLIVRSAEQPLPEKTIWI